MLEVGHLLQCYVDEEICLPIDVDLLDISGVPHPRGGKIWGPIALFQLEVLFLFPFPVFVGFGFNSIQPLLNFRGG